MRASRTEQAESACKRDECFHGFGGLTDDHWSPIWKGGRSCRCGVGRGRLAGRKGEEAERESGEFHFCFHDGFKEKNDETLISAEEAVDQVS